ncbi:glial cell line-derived neurotrophic factor-like [Thalassophryne amazonica]|uniref:glial cell line-derived neurotrophic factor-like n=1 Tax=Thalassophryne amazonica TaxID=390379 RepID=UPI00147187CC|nr:glial cell line-derived neurotrophic factor-like [Thalassophryne amazonica]
MKLWDSLIACLVLLSAVHQAVHAGPLLPNRRQSACPERRRRAESPLELPPIQIRQAGTSGPETDRGPIRGDKHTMEEPLPMEFADMVDFIKVTISGMHHTSLSTQPSSIFSSTASLSMQNLRSRTKHRREKKEEVASHQRGEGKRGSPSGVQTGRKARARGGSGREQGCMLKQIHLNVSDLGLGYLSSEEMIFRYCSGPCKKSETNYDKILYNLVNSRRLPVRDTSSHACCRPVAFDDDLSFLDDNLLYHTVRKHSARKCGCV